jgi:hypothetical protein
MPQEGHQHPSPPVKAIDSSAASHANRHLCLNPMQTVMVPCTGSG